MKLTANQAARGRGVQFSGRRILLGAPASKQLKRQKYRQFRKVTDLERALTHGGNTKLLALLGISYRSVYREKASQPRPKARLVFLDYRRGTQVLPLDGTLGIRPWPRKHAIVVTLLTLGPQNFETNASAARETLQMSGSREATATGAKRLKT